MLRSSVCQSFCHVLFVPGGQTICLSPGGQTFLTHKRGGTNISHTQEVGETNIFHTQGGGQTFSQTGGREGGPTFSVGGNGGDDYSYREETYVQKLVSVR